MLVVHLRVTTMSPSHLLGLPSVYLFWAALSMLAPYLHKGPQPYLSTRLLRPLTCLLLEIKSNHPLDKWAYKVALMHRCVFGKISVQQFSLLCSYPFQVGWSVTQQILPFLMRRFIVANARCKKLEMHIQVFMLDWGDNFCSRVFSGDHAIHANNIYNRITWLSHILIIPGEVVE